MLNLFGNGLIGRVNVIWDSVWTESDPGIWQYVYNRRDERNYYLKDHLACPPKFQRRRSSIRLTVNESGNIISAQDYYPYGEILRSYTTGANVNDKYKYIGRFRRIHQILRTEKERDTETDYDYFGARFYDSKLVRWLQVDPLADKYPGWSLYNYALNNPIKFIDPKGMDVDEFGMERQGLEGEGMRVINRHRYLDDLGKDNSITGRYKNIYVKKFQPFYFSQISYTFPESDKPSPLEFIKVFSGTFFVSGYWEIDKLINGQWYVSLYAMAKSNIENDGKVDYWGILSLIKNNKEIENKPLEKDYNSLIPENWSHVGGNYFLLPEQGNIDLKLYVDYNITYPSGNANPIIKLSRTINIYSGKGQ